MGYRFIEIIGCAGSGKSTAINNLCTQNSEHISDMLQHAYNKAFRRCFVRTCPRRLFLLSRGVRRHSIKTFLRVESMLQVIQNMSKRNSWINTNTNIWLDQGPFFKLAYLLIKQEPRTKITKKWFYRLTTMLQQAEYQVIWLDAADSVLDFRIKTRQQNHPLKNVNDHQLLAESVSSWRNAYSKLLNDFDISITCDYLRTDQQTPESLAQTLKDKAIYYNQKSSTKQCQGVPLTRH